MIFDLCVQLHENVSILSSIYCCAFEHPFDQYKPINIKKECHHHFSSWCFRCMWLIFLLPCQRRLLAGQYMIMAPWFITRNHVVEKHVFLFWKASEILFANGEACSMLFGSQYMRYQLYPVSAYSLLFQFFFVTIFWAVPFYAAFTWYTISDNLNFWLGWMIMSTLFSSILSATKIGIP